MTEERDARLEKVQKLLTKAERASSEAEASAFFAKAEELMTKWAIDDAMLQAAGKLEREEIGDRIVKVASTYFNADITLLAGIGRAHDVRLLQSKERRYAHLFGFPSDMDNVERLYVLLQLQAARFARQEFDHEPAEERRYMSKMDEYVWRRSFREGFARRIEQRLVEQRKRTTQEQSHVHGSGMELVLVDRKNQVDAFFQAVPKGTARASRSRYDSSGGAAGRRAGDRADIGNKRVSGRKAIG